MTEITAPLPDPIPTWGEIRQMLADLARLQAEDRLQMQQSHERAEHSRAETDRQIQALRAETDRQIQLFHTETDRQIQLFHTETDRQIQLLRAETDRQFQETNRIVKATAKQLGELGNRLGEFVEHRVEPAVVRLFQQRGLEVRVVMHNIEVQATAQREGMQIDLLVINGGTLVVVECKSKLTLAHLAEHTARMEKFRRLMPHYREYQALAAFATMVAESDVVEEAIAAGFFVLVQSGESVALKNSDQFVPKIW